MKPFAERVYFAREVTTAYQLASFAIDKLKEREPEIRCHELAFATSSLIASAFYDRVTTSVWSGHYGAVEHSWLTVRSLVEPIRSLVPTILDVYAVGRTPQVQLVDGSSFLPEYRMYIRGKSRSDLDQRLIKELLIEMKSAIRSQALTELAGQLYARP